MPDLILAEAALERMAGLLMLEASPRKLARFKRQAEFVAEQRRVRAKIGRALTSDIDNYFTDLSKRVSGRMRKSVGDYAANGLPDVGYLLTDEDDARMEKLLQKYYISVVRESWKIWNTELGIDLAFNLTDPLVTTILGGCGTKIRAISQTTRDAVRATLQYGSSQGWSIQQLVKGDPENGIPGLRDIVEETYKNRAKTIARTELGTAQNDATVVRYQAADVRKVRVFDNGKDDDDEPCKKVNGTIKTLEWAMENKLQHPNCFVGDTVVRAPNLRAGFFREFDGEVIVLHTAANHNVTCTANHPILTSRGWVSAGKLIEGDQVVYALNSERIVRLLDPDNDQVPTTIENLARAFRETRGVTTRTVPGTDVDFHGDGSKGEVGIIDINRLLRNRANAVFSQPLSEFPFVVGDEVSSVEFLGLGAHQQFGTRSGFASNRTMRGTSHRGTFSGSAMRHGDGLGFAPISQYVPSRVETMAQGPARNSDFRGKCLATLSSSIASVQSDEIDLAAQSKATIIKQLTQAMRGESNTLGNLASTLTRLVSLVELVEIERKKFSGHVYNLETEQGWYIANGIISHNCTRAFGAEIDY